MTITITEILTKFTGPLATVALWAVIAACVVCVAVACVRGKCIGVTGQVLLGLAAWVAAIALACRRARDRTR